MLVRKLRKTLIKKKRKEKKGEGWDNWKGYSHNTKKNCNRFRKVSHVNEINFDESWVFSSDAVYSAPTVTTFFHSSSMRSFYVRIVYNTIVTKID